MKSFLCKVNLFLLGLYWGLMSQQQPGSHQGGDSQEGGEYPQETTDLRQVPWKLSHTGSMPSVNYRLQQCETMGSS